MVAPLSLPATGDKPDGLSVSSFPMLLISILRGVNVGPYRRIRMEALQAIYESLKLRNPQTYGQSGNVLFRTQEQDLAQLAARIEDRIEQRFEFRPDVILRTLPELREAVAKNPFAKRHSFEAGKLLVCFLADDPGKKAWNEIRRMKIRPEELRIKGRELYIYFPGGMAGSKLPMAQIEKTLKAAAAGRKWNSVTKLLQIAERLETNS